MKFNNVMEGKFANTNLYPKTFICILAFIRYTILNLSKALAKDISHVCYNSDPPTCSSIAESNIILGNSMAFSYGSCSHDLRNHSFIRNEVNASEPTMSIDRYLTRALCLPTMHLIVFSIS